MKTLFENITVADQEVASSYIKTSNLALFDVFPQFNDAELANSLSSFRDKYSIVWIKHCELYPGIDSIQRREEIKRITECATGKIKLEEFELLRLADDPCETQRRNCIASVSAEAAVMHMGCAALDLSIIGGIICHGAAFAYQWTAGNNCNINAQLCREGRIKNTQH
ncbi:MAG TPA: hypothetical protein PKI55_05815 [Chitinophagaceae bacterium]|nr:hypothetical protein [Chitinophagaceae bacterium]